MLAFLRTAKFKVTRRWGGAVAALLIGLGSAFTAIAAAPPAGTVIDNQARGTYVDANGVTRTVASNLVTTTVQQVKSFRLDQPGITSGSPGQRVFLPHVITNTGNGTDNYTFIAPVVTAGTAGVTNLGYFADADNDGQPDVGAPNLAGTTVTLPAGQQLRFVLAATIPMGASTGTSNTVRVSANDTEPTTRVNDDVINVVSAQAGVVKRIRDAAGAVDVSQIPPLTATVLRVVLEYTTSGTVPVTNLTIEDALPAGFTYRGNARWNGQPLGDAAGNADDPVGISYEGGGRNARAVIATVPIGGSGSISFDIEASNQLAPTDISLLGSGTCAAPAINSRCPELTRNTGRFTFTPQGGSPQPNTNTNTVQVIVTQRAGVVANDGAAPPVVGANDIVSQPSAPPNGVVRFDDFIYNTGDFNDSFRVTLLNAGACNHTATGANACTFPAGTSFVIYGADGVTPLSNSTTPVVPPFNGNAANRTRVVVEARLPTPSQLTAAGIPAASLPNTNGGNGYRITLQAQSITTPPVINAAASDPVVNVLQAIIATRADLTLNTPRADSMPPGSANASNASTTGFDFTGTTILNQATPAAVTPNATQPSVVVFPLYVNNTAAVPDEFGRLLLHPPSAPAARAARRSPAPAWCPRAATAWFAL
jgi:trimeric autotransporter adhesin